MSIVVCVYLISWKSNRVIVFGLLITLHDPSFFFLGTSEDMIHYLCVLSICDLVRMLFSGKFLELLVLTSREMS